MARCPYLDYKSNSFWGNSSDKYICRLTSQQMDVDDSKVKYTCNADNDDMYKKCQIYKEKR